MKTPMTFDGMLASASLIFVLLAVSGGSAGAADAVAIKGYDPVAYFTMGKAVHGNETFSFAWHNLTWCFMSKQHRDLFAANPEHYAPQYDGWCAWAMTESRKAVTDPEVWKIVDGKLYLNCSQHAFEKWSKDIPGNIRKADAIWQQMNAGK